MDASVFWNKRIRNLTPYVPGEQPRGQAFIKLNTNENPYPPSSLVLEAVKNAANERLRLYPDPQAFELRGAIAGKYGCKTGNIFTGNGSDEILAFAFGAFFENRGSDAACGSGPDSGAGGLPAVCFPDVTYSFYPVYAGFWGLNYRTFPLAPAWQIDVNDYSGVLSGRSGVILANPNAPTGLVLPRAEILRLARALLKQDRILIVDEAYADFSDESVASYIEEYKNLLVVKTFSKSFSLAGLRVGFALGAPELTGALERLRDSFNSYTLDAVSQAGAAAAIKDSAYYDSLRAKIIATRERISAELGRRGFDVLPSGANFVFVKHPALSGGEFLKRLRENLILVRHFNSERTKNHLRITIGTDVEMDKFLEICGRL